MDAFEGNTYHLQVYGPNGFFREFKGNKNDPKLSLNSSYSLDTKSNTGYYNIEMENTSQGKLTIEVRDNAYNHGKNSMTVLAGEKQAIRVSTSKSKGWYDFTLRTIGNTTFSRRYCGRLELGLDSISDPLMGGVVSFKLG